MKNSESDQQICERVDKASGWQSGTVGTAKGDVELSSKLVHPTPPPRVVSA
jgi:hypothetical protein